MPTAIEQHVDWITDCVRHVRGRRLARIEAREDAAERWVEQVNEAAHATLLPTAASSWHVGATLRQASTRSCPDEYAGMPEPPVPRGLARNVHSRNVPS